MSVVTSEGLRSVLEVEAAIAAGESMFLAGSREMLSLLPRGNWIGGTITYFITEDGGVFTKDLIYVTPVPFFALGADVMNYGPEDLSQLYRDAPANGFTYVVMPASTVVLQTFAEQAPDYAGFLVRPVVGWVSGVPVERIGIDPPAVFNGKTGAVFEDQCVAMHVKLPDNKMADLDIVNIFDGGDGDVIRFDNAGFCATDCVIGGQPVNLADYICLHAIKTEFPLIGDYNGSSINVSFLSVDPIARTVQMYAPVFAGVDYRFAKPIGDYSGAFASMIASENKPPDFACNCILNYVYGKLEGKKTGNITGPVTFGEIAHQLLNQTMVRLYLRDVGQRRANIWPVPAEVK